MSERLSGGYAETQYDPELAEILEFMETYTKIQEVLSWLVESGANAPFLKGVKRAQLQKLMQQIGIDTDNPDDPGGYKQLAELQAGFADRSLHPRPRVEIPDSKFFGRRITEVKSEYQRLGPPPSSERPLAGSVSLLDVTQFGHTEWSKVQSRTGHLPSEIHRIATVMADPVAYYSWAYGGGGRAADHISMSEDWSIQNGRHRALAVICLGEDFISESAMSQWVPIAVEQWE